MERAPRIRWVLSLLLGMAAACGTPAADSAGGVAGMVGGRLGQPAATPVRVLMSRAPVPVGGAIVLESFESVEPTVEVRDPSGALVIGHYNYPDQPFVPGRYTVTFHTFTSEIPTVVPITVVEAFGAELPVLNSEPTANSLVSSSQPACCRTPEGEPTTHCEVVEQRTALMLDLALSSTAPGPLNQYFFRIAPTQESGAADALEDFLPFSMVKTVTFFDTRDEYCVELEMQNVATLELRTYPELRICVPAGDIEVGVHRIALDAAFFKLDACPTPPDGMQDEWCTVNAPGCVDSAASECDPLQALCYPVRWR